MKPTFRYLLLLLFIPSISFSQDQPTDSSTTMDEIIVRSFEQYRKPSSTTANVKVITLSNASGNNKSSLVSGFNTVAGVRMEERSPGSYRINIRGSSLRSPFGVRNVKVYWNGIPITDPGGNTYFNQFAYNNFSTIEIFKGPPGSLYGAGTGGLVMMNNLDKWQPGASLEYMAGSFGLKNVFASASFGKTESGNRNHLTYAHNESDGYREQTAMRRDNVSWTTSLKSSEKQELMASLLYTDMYYQTPGALTLTEFEANPKASRPAGGGFPSAVNAKAAIFQKTIVAGFANQYHFSSAFRNNTSLYGAFAQIKNAAIRNYERRNEPHFGGRSSFIYSTKINSATLNLVGGGEFQQGYFNTQVSKNRNGNPDTLQTNDDVNYTTYCIFTQADIEIRENWIITAGLSVNKSKVEFKRLSVYPITAQRRTYKNELAPRLSVLRKIGQELSVLATVATGFSPPTVAELLPSTGNISTDLEAEKGTNYELTVRYNMKRQRLNFEVTGFYFNLHDALVQRRDLSGADFFTNAGEVKEKGLEIHSDYTFAPIGNALIDNIVLQADYTYNHFRYGSFIKGTSDFTGKEVPSVPANTFSAMADIYLQHGVYVNSTYYTASRIFLNDANTFSAKSYQVLGARLGWKTTLKSKYRINLYAGADNLLDEVYSLGNDINAAANRFYNAAPRRNYYAGISWQWLAHSKKATL
ncbi:MAG: TonB-dependent receptor [Chitinophagaceae bacterium]|nr:TonB-dependent receptor [Chitinophagaceae bacterium]